MLRYARYSLLALLLIAGCEDKGGRADTAASAHKKEPVKRVARFGALTIGERVLTSFPISQDEPKRWHYRVQLLDDVVQSYAWVSPAGVVHERAEFSYKGGFRGRFYDGYAQELRSTHLKSRKLTEKRRDGSTTVLGCAALALKFDELGRVVSRTCKDKDDQSIGDQAGCFKVTRRWTNEHQLAEEACFGEGDVPIADGAGVHRRIYSYNDKGQRTSLSFYTVANKPRAATAGCVLLGYEYDDAFNRVAEICRDGSGQPMAMLGTEAVRVELRYDANGCETAQQYRRADGSRTTRNRIGERRTIPDKLCEVLAKETRDLKGKLAPPYRGAPARRELDRDALGLVSEERCFDQRTKPAACYATSGIAQVLRYGYDAYMREASEAGFSAAGKPMRRMRDYPHLVHYHYDDQGRLTKKEFFDADGKPAKGLKAAHAIVSEYDAFGMLKRRKNLGLQGEPVIPATRCATLSFSRNALHQLTRIDCLDQRGLPTKSRLVYAGVNWKSAASVELLREGGRLRNVFRSKEGRIVKELDCSREGVRCIR